MIGQPFPVEVVRDVILTISEGITRTRDSNNAPRIYTYTSTASDYGDIHIILSVPESLVLADANVTRIQSIAVLVVIAVFGIGGAGLSSRVMTAPIQALQQALRRLASGDLGSRLEFEADTNELQQLLLTFNEMAATVESRMAAQDTTLTAVNAERAQLLEAERTARQRAETLALNLARLQSVTAALG
jgi:methyl-accepting chemotaxis protein